MSARSPATIRCSRFRAAAQALPTTRPPSSTISASPCSASRRRASSRRGPPQRRPSVEYEDLPAITHRRTTRWRRRRPAGAALYARKAAMRRRRLRTAPHAIEGRIEIGGQEHFYLEGQAALAVPGEDEDIAVHSSSQHPTEIQHTVAKVLGVPNHSVTIEVRRMGGGFGGKESQGNLPAAAAALAAHVTGRPAKCVYDRDDDMIITGKRHDFRIGYRAGFDDSGRILGVEFDQALRCGMSWDLSGTDRRPRDVPRRQLLLPAERPDYLVPLQDQHPVQHRLPRLRRAAGHDRDRARAIDRIAASLGQGSGRRSAPSTSIADKDSDDDAGKIDALRHGGGRLYHRGYLVGTDRNFRLYEKTGTNPGLEPGKPGPEARHRHDAGEVRHLLHQHDAEPGRCAGACLQ